MLALSATKESVTTSLQSTALTAETLTFKDPTVHQGETVRLKLDFQVVTVGVSLQPQATTPYRKESPRWLAELVSSDVWNQMFALQPAELLDIQQQLAKNPAFSHVKLYRNTNLFIFHRRLLVYSR